MRDATPKSIGPYRPIRLLSTGMSGQVWLARGPDGEVALKVARNDEHRASIARESRVLAAVTHANLVRMVNADPKHRWIALEHIEGVDYERWSRERPVSDLMRATAQLVDVLFHLHARGVIHTDVKPSNVLVDSYGRIHLLDLGSAQLTSERTTRLRGTPGYMPPEVLRGEPPGPASDLYAVGALLYVALTGRTPFTAPDPIALSYLPTVTLPLPPATHRGDVPALLNHLVMALLARKPERRPALRNQIRSLLARAAADGQSAAKPVLGMEAERDQLSRALVTVSEGGTRVVVVYGVPGSGRRTLIAEAIESGRREGLTHLPDVDPKGVVTQAQQSERPLIVACSADRAGAVPAALELLRTGTPGMLMLRAERPITVLDDPRVVQVTPRPLSRDESRELIGRLDGPVDEAEAIWRASLGHPLAIHGRVHVWRHKHGKPTRPFPLSKGATRVLHALEDGEPKALPDLARDLGLTENALLDHCEILFALEQIEPVERGTALRRIA